MAMIKTVMKKKISELRFDFGMDGFYQVHNQRGCFGFPKMS